MKFLQKVLSEVLLAHRRSAWVSRVVVQKRKPRPAKLKEEPSWSFLTTHGHLLLLIARDRDATMREMAQALRLTERSVQVAIADLVRAGYLSIEKIGRRNRYEVHPHLPMPHPYWRDYQVTDLLRIVTKGKPASPASRARSSRGTGKRSAADERRGIPRRSIERERRSSSRKTRSKK